MRQIKHTLKFIRKPISHDKLSIIKKYDYDSWNKIDNGQAKHVVYYNNDNVGYIDFRCFTGQVGLIYVKDIYRRYGIANYMLSIVEDELIQNNIDKLWAICSKDHYFWGEIHKSQYIFVNRPHKSVTGSGENVLI